MVLAEILSKLRGKSCTKDIQQKHEEKHEMDVYLERSWNKELYYQGTKKIFH